MPRQSVMVSGHTAHSFIVTSPAGLQCWLQDGCIKLYCIPELTELLERERDEVERLETEKKAWLTRGVQAEFEKKNRVSEDSMVCCFYLMHTAAPLKF